MKNTKYEAFLIAAESKSLAKTARIMNFTPSAISQLIKTLENELGFQLFHRNNKGVKLTENGKVVLPVIRNINNLENHLEQLMYQIQGLNTGEINIAAYSSISTHWLPEVISIFRKKYPDIKIKLMEGIRQEVVQWLEDDIADIAFMSYKEPMNYTWYDLKKDPMFAVIPLNHPLASCGSFPLEQFNNTPFIMPALGKDSDVIDLVEKYNLHLDIAFTTLENFAAMAMIEQGLGISIMNELITKRWECNVAKLQLDPPQWINLGLCVKSLKEATPATKKFIKLTQEYFNDSL